MNLKLDYKAPELGLIDMKVFEAAMQHTNDLNHITDFENGLTRRIIELDAAIKVQNGLSYSLITKETSGTVEIWKIYLYGAYKKLLIRLSVI